MEMSDRRGARKRSSSNSNTIQDSYLDSSSSSSSSSSWISRLFGFVRIAEFEILFVLFFLTAFLIFKHLTSSPEYNQIFVKKPAQTDFWRS